MSEENKSKPAGDSTSEKPTPIPTHRLADALETHERIERAIEPLIREKIAAGLTRPQALEVIKAQQAHDAALEAASNPRQQKSKQA